MSRSKVFGCLYVALAAVIWGSNGVIVNMVPLNAYAIAFFRVLFASLTLAPVTFLTRKKEFELMHLLGATCSYIRLPFFFEGALHGLLGSMAGMGALYVLFNWINIRFAGSLMLEMFSFNFFPLPVMAIIAATAVILCGGGTISSTRRIFNR